MALVAGCGSPSGIDGGMADLGPSPALDQGVRAAGDTFVLVAQGREATNVSAVAGTWRSTVEACGRITVGACTVFRCTGDARFEEAVVDAPLTATSTGGSVTLEPVDRAYPSAPGTGPRLWEAGDVLVVDGDVRANLMPGVGDGVVYGSPPLFIAGPTEVSRSADLDVTWRASDEAAGELHVLIESTADDGAMARARCTFPVAAESGVIPASILREIPTVEPFVTVGVGELAEVAPAVGVRVLAIDAVVDQDGLVASGRLALTE